MDIDCTSLQRFQWETSLKPELPQKSGIRIIFLLTEVPFLAYQKYPVWHAFFLTVGKPKQCSSLRPVECRVQ